MGIRGGMRGCARERAGREPREFNAEGNVVRPQQRGNACPTQLSRRPHSLDNLPLINLHTGLYHRFAKRRARPATHMGCYLERADHREKDRLVTEDTLKEAISRFGAKTKSKLTNPATVGAPEDQLRAPLEDLTHDLAVLVGLPDGAINMVGETSLADLHTRPDYAVIVHNALVGFIEVKAPGKGADPRRFKDAHDKEQWRKLKSLPNLIYTDGNAFSLWQNGELQKLVQLSGDIETSGKGLTAPPTIIGLFSDFLGWNPIPPHTAKQLAEVSARLCRLLRDEVTEQLAVGSPGLTDLAADWRTMLFPEASDKEFADGYAQAVTFGLLVARAKDISLADGIEKAALELRHANSLIGTALWLLTDDNDNKVILKTSLGTLTRVLDAVSWWDVSKGDPDAWLYFYEDFLAVYDNTLRKCTGSYYTPPEVVGSMVRLVDEALRSADLFNHPHGLASSDVTVADPAAGTGTFLLGVLRKIATTVEADQGAGAVGPAIAAAAKRLIGFELQFGPFAVAQLRILAEMQSLMQPTSGAPPPVPELRLFITDTLGNPFVEDEKLPQILQPIARSRRDANTIKRQEPITVVIGNPPYKEKAKGHGGWIESGSDGRAAPLDRWMPPAAWGVGAHTKHLRNLYIYFWRWATWKVFGTGLHDSTGLKDTDKAGIVCFITVAGFLNGPGFQRMRDDLRRSCAAIWVIDCSPEGHQPEVATRIFQGVQQTVCIVLAARTLANNPDVPAPVHFHRLPEGRREEKFAALANLSFSGTDWTDCPDGWRDPFLPTSTGAWANFPALDDLFLYNGSGVMPGRTWVVAPDADSLRRRWSVLISEKETIKQSQLFHPHQNGDRAVTKQLKAGLHGHEYRPETVANDQQPCITPVRYAYRSLDRQWIIPDNRLINRPNPTLWSSHSEQQVYLTALEAHSSSGGPAVTFCGNIPDLHHYKGSFGGRAYPLWKDRETAEANIKPALLNYFSGIYGNPVSANDVMAYFAALLAHSAFIERFKEDLILPGMRVPLTAEAALYAEAVELGQEVIWLHTFGERFSDASRGRLSGPPRLPKKKAPHIPGGGAIPGAPEPLPDTMDYDATQQRLHIGKGYVDNVPPAVWSYEVSGKNILRQWFSYRQRDRSRPIMGDRRPPSALGAIQPDAWPAEYTSDLIDLLHVLGRLVALEPKQADLLERICSAPTINEEELRAAGALAVPKSGKGAGSKATDPNQIKLI